MQLCGAKKRNGMPCKAHVVHGAQRCRMHGGKSLKGADSPQFKHGIYSDYYKDSMRAKLTTMQTGNPLDLLPELEMQRVLLAEYLARFQTGSNPTAFDMDFMVKWLAEIGKSVERIVKLKNETALTQAEMQFLAARVVDLVARYINDPEQQRKFIEELFVGVVDKDQALLSG